VKAAIVTSFDRPPRYGEVAEPVPEGRHQMLVEVLAAGLHHVTRGRASGAHYSGSGELPLIPGIDGVGRDRDGRLRYFVQGPELPGSMAGKTVIEVDHSIKLPKGCDPVTMAAALNPAMASWLALRCRIPFRKKMKVLVLGATGSSGRMAVQIARYLGASQVIAAGRDEGRLTRLSALGATEVVKLGDPRLGTLARDVDVVLDFVWGDSVGQTMETIARQRSDRNRLLSWVHVGSMAGEEGTIPGAVLRAANVQVVGSGHGSVSGRAILSALPALIKEIARGRFQIDVKAVPLADVEQAWDDTSPGGERIVFIP
jgi:NADPH:quinone reductase and related Zn-dependent oxidoreductases